MNAEKVTSLLEATFSALKSRLFSFSHYVRCKVESLKIDEKVAEMKTHLSKSRFSSMLMNNGWRKGSFSSFASTTAHAQAMDSKADWAVSMCSGPLWKGGSSTVQECKFSRIAPSNNFRPKRWLFTWKRHLFCVHSIFRIPVRLLLIYAGLQKLSYRLRLMCTVDVFNSLSDNYCTFYIKLASK